MVVQLFGQETLYGTIAEFVKVVIVTGLGANVAMLIFDWRRHLSGSTVLPRERFFALRWFVRFKWITALVLALGSIVVAIVVAASIDYNELAGIIRWTGVDDAVRTFFWVTVVAYSARQLSGVEQRLRSSVSQERASADYFGVQFFATVYRFSAVAVALIVFLSSVGFGLLVDSNSSGVLAFLVIIIGTAFSVVIYIVLGALPDILKLLLRIEAYSHKMPMHQSPSVSDGKIAR